LPDLEVLAPGLAAKGLVISPESEPEPEPARAPDAPPAPGAGAAADDDIPTLFESARIAAPQQAEPASALPQDTQPEPQAPPTLELEAEPPQAEAAPPALELDTEPPQAEAAPPALELDAEPPQAEAAPPAQDTADKPDWDRDPTLAELRPDIEALEQALADFEDPDEAPVEKEPEPEIAVELKDPTLPGVPEITLDSAIQSEVTEAQKKLAEGNVANTAEGAENPESQKANIKASPPPAPIEMPGVSDDAKQKQADQQLEKIATDLARAKTLEDVDDKAAETLFGEEFSMLAAQVAASVSDPEAANQEIPAADDTPSAAAAEPQPAAEPQSAMEQEFKEVYGDDALEVSLESSTGGMDLSASQRLATVRAVNAGKPPAAAGNTAPPAPAAPAQPAATPDPIEDQINTSMTQTLKALGTRPGSAVNDDDDDDDTKGGFFSRFRRS
ncbi:MAG: hypothetical protein R3358_08660, partial [Woeseiaceae bacterium]|nr:hypothetical protein [Woeseiaceae bacterium]